ncbi:NACHT domain-containing protein [Winogradskyella sp. A3E31]|uniref:NACHT domain-containing protein n=1 Tax=Winogradskyella sp. A3E31 TaxID=3349637 RepID=UPI00398AD61B
MKIKLNSSKLDYKIEKKKIFQNLFDFNLGSTVSEILDVNKSKESKAFELLYNTTQKTNIELSKELDQKIIDNTKNLVVKYESIIGEWKEFFEQEITISAEFFHDVLQHDPEYLKKSFILFSKYLSLLKINIPNGYYYKYYVRYRNNLSQEFETNPSKYQVLIDAFSNPIELGNPSFTNLMNHYISINKHYISYLQPDVPDSNETLADLYTEPYFKVYKNNLSKKSSENTDFLNPSKKLTIHDYLNNYYLIDKPLPGSRKNYNMIFILGQPGQGKTSFCYKLVYDILKKSNGLPNTPLLFIKIRDLVAKDFINDTFNTINNHLSQNINFTKDGCLLVLDGLDEAYMSGGLTDEDLKNLYERLNKTSQQNNNLKIVLTSRLNYLKYNDPSVEGSMVLYLSVLDDKQLKSYVDKFTGFYPENHLTKKIDDIIQKKNYAHIKELLQQPVIMYFIALADIIIDRSDSKAIIYDKIFDSLAKRSWDKNGQLNYIKPSLKEDYGKYSKYLRQFIRNIAFEIYQSPNLHISVKKLNSLDSTANFIKKCFHNDLSKDSERIKEVSKYLLISFYFQQSNKDQEEDTAIEFFHNSLWEFLTAEYMWEENKRLVLNKDEDNDLIPLGMENYFALLQGLIGNKELKAEIRENIKNIIRIEKSDLKKQITKQTKSVFYKLIKQEIVLDYNYKVENLNVVEKSQSIFELLWTFYYESGIDFNNKIATNTSLNNYLLFKSPFSHRYYLKNIEFNDDMNDSYITQCEIVNVDFNLHIVTIYLDSNRILDSKFTGIFYDLKMHHSNLVNVSFINSYISDNSILKENSFKNCKFENVQVKNRKWFNQFKKDNSFDEATIKNLKLTLKNNDVNSDKQTKTYHMNN